MKKIIFSQYGRSMVEMLGVLAIIGVLSVGSISGYSKAMMKYKMNKFATSMNELLNTSIQYTGQLYSDSNYTDGSGTQYFAEILYKMNALPNGIKYRSPRNLGDMFGNEVWTFSSPKNKTSGLGYEISRSGNSNLSSEICQQLINLAKENSSQLTRISTNSYDATEKNETSINRYYGDSSCSKDVKCIKSMTLSDIDTACHSFLNGQQAKFYFIWK